MILIKTLIIILFSSFITSISIFQTLSLQTSKGICRGLWRKDKLLGKCFGLNLHTKYSELEEIQVVKSPEECRSLCCYLGNKCVTWQFQYETNVCKLGDPVRLGFEGSNTVNWCDPHPPNVWNGKELDKREKNVCKWGKDLPNQCFGLGPERLHPITKKPLNSTECESFCCQSNDCEIWQQADGRGCYYSSSKGIGCDKTKEPPYTGGRKCIPNFCGSIEEETKILSAYNASQNKS